MILLTLLLWLAALLATVAAVAFYRWAGVSRGWRIFHMTLIVPATLFVALFSLAAGWASGPPITLLFLSGVLLMSAWQWKVDLFVARWLDKRLSGGREIFTPFLDSPAKKRREPRPPNETRKA